MFIFRCQQPFNAKSNGFEIKVLKSDWGQLKEENVQYLLELVTRQFLIHFDTSFAVSLNVECRPRYARPEVTCLDVLKAKHLVTLVTYDYRSWCFQWAHEVGHIISGYDNLHLTPNKWFHESICELASIFTLRQIGMTGKSSQSPYLHNIGEALFIYIEGITTSPDYQLPNNTTFQEWFKLTEQSLRADPYQRSHNGIVALRLLPLFERDPTKWRAICFIPDSAGSFNEFLEEWRETCPEIQKAFVEEIRKCLGF